MTVDPEYVAETLEWCNEVRAEHGDPPLEALPVGRRYDPKTCPCGLATGVWVEKTIWYTIGREFQRGEEHHLPEAVKEFIYEFDNGQLPQYEDLLDEGD